MSRTAMSQGIVALYGASSGGIAYLHESGNMGTASDPLSWSITSGAYYLNDTQDRLMLRDVNTDFGLYSNTPGLLGTVTVAIYASDRAYNLADFSVAQATQSVTFTISTVGRKSLRVSGRLMMVSISGNDAAGTQSSTCHIGKLTFDVVKLGER